MEKSALKTLFHHHRTTVALSDGVICARNITMTKTMVGGGAAAEMNDGRRVCIRYSPIQFSSLYYYYIFTHYHMDDWTVYNSKWLQIATVAVTRSVRGRIRYLVENFLFSLCVVFKQCIFVFVYITTTFVYAAEYSRSILSEL